MAPVKTGDRSDLIYSPARKYGILLRQLHQHNLDGPYVQCSAATHRHDVLLWQCLYNFVWLSSLGCVIWVTEIHSFRNIAIPYAKWMDEFSELVDRLLFELSSFCWETLSWRDANRILKTNYQNKQNKRKSTLNVNIYRTPDPLELNQYNNVVHAEDNYLESFTVTFKLKTENCAVGACGAELNNAVNGPLDIIYAR